MFCKRLRVYLDGVTWAEYESTFAGPGIEEQWEAFFHAVSLFRRVAREVAEELGYEFPKQVDREMTEYYQWIRALSRDGAIGSSTRKS